VGPKEEQIFNKYFPKESVAYCLGFWSKYKIQFTISKPRKSVYGNYIYRAGIHSISVNGDLNPEAFLVTYLHEVAHLLVHVDAKKRVLPHGKEWQNHFREVMKPMIFGGIFLKEMAERLWLHLQSPKATSCSDPDLHKLLMKTEEAPEGTMVESLLPQQKFIYDSRTFMVLRKLRTRIECLEIKNSQIYRFNAQTRIRVWDQDLEIAKETAKKRYIHHLPIGSRFKWNQRHFLLHEKRRTRFLCEDLSNGKRYLINQMVSVDELS